MFLPRLAYPVQSCCSWSTAPTSAFVKQPTFNIIKIRQSLLQIQCKINSKMIAFSMCLHRFADAVPSCCSLSTAPASAFLKQPTFSIIKIWHYLLQLQFKINSETTVFSVFLPRLTDPVPSCCSLSTAPVSTSLKQPTFRIIKIGKYLLQLHIKFNSEMITFSMFLPRLTNPVSSCCSLSTGWLTLFGLLLLVYG